jgi:hypothetical protein
LAEVVDPLRRHNHLDFEIHPLVAAITNPMKQAPDISRAVPLRSHRHRGIRKLVLSQGAQESDGIEQIRFAHAIPRPQCR